MSVVVVVTVYPIPEHRAEVVAALARLSGRIWCHRPNLRVGAGGMSRATGLAAATPPR